MSTYWSMADICNQSSTLNPPGKAKQWRFTSQNKAYTATWWLHMILHIYTAYRPLNNFFYFLYVKHSDDLCNCWSQSPTTTLPFNVDLHGELKWILVNFRGGKHQTSYKTGFSTTSEYFSRYERLLISSYLHSKMPLVYFIRSHWMINTLRRQRGCRNNTLVWLLRRIPASQFVQCKIKYWGRIYCLLLDLF